jgi:stearoyl-CoA desaturase (delta-9 desaturase)
MFSINFISALIVALILTHITIASVTIYLHRCQAHRGLMMHPVLSHFMRLWLWLTTGMITKQWVAIHRKHHRFTDESEDPHSPKVYGIFYVLFYGAFLYSRSAKDKDMVDAYGVGTPNDWIERNIYTPYNWLGILLMLIIDIFLFGPLGIILWGVQMLWIPFWAAGVINGIGHYIGYRNTNTKDSSTNIVPWGIIIGGEELHNNHHENPANPKLSRKWWEFDIGWMWISVFKFLGLVKIK